LLEAPSAPPDFNAFTVIPHHKPEPRTGDLAARRAHNVCIPKRPDISLSDQEPSEFTRRLFATHVRFAPEKQTCAVQEAVSALPPKADIRSDHRNVR
jgi:hypothetical protein